MRLWFLLKSFLKKVVVFGMSSLNIIQRDCDFPLDPQIREECFGGGIFNLSPRMVRRVNLPLVLIEWIKFLPLDLVVKVLVSHLCAPVSQIEGAVREIPFPSFSKQKRTHERFSPLVVNHPKKMYNWFISVRPCPKDRFSCISFLWLLNHTFLCVYIAMFASMGFLDRSTFPPFSVFLPPYHCFRVTCEPLEFFSPLIHSTYSCMIH